MQNFLSLLVATLVFNKAFLLDYYFIVSIIMKSFYCLIVCLFLLKYFSNTDYQTGNRMIIVMYWQ